MKCGGGGEDSKPLIVLTPKNKTRNNNINIVGTIVYKYKIVAKM